MLRPTFQTIKFSNSPNSPSHTLEELTAAGLSNVYCRTKVVGELESILNDFKTPDEMQESSPGKMNIDTVCAPLSPFPFPVLTRVRPFRDLSCPRVRSSAEQLVESVPTLLRFSLGFLGTVSHRLPPLRGPETLTADPCPDLTLSHN